MTTLAIIGSGIAGRSLLYTLAKEQKFFTKVTLFHSDKFAIPCTLTSTAIVAPRGVTEGKSPLGDLLLEGYRDFADHVEGDHPVGVESIPQLTAASTKLEIFRSRYPDAQLKKEFLKKDTLMAEEKAFLVDPSTYLSWLLAETKKISPFPVEIIEDFVIEVEKDEKVKLKTQNGREFTFDKVIFAGGSYNRFWKGLAPETNLKSSKSVQGSYLEFNQVEWERSSFSLTLNGDNLIWNRPKKRLLIGSTTLEAFHVLPPLAELKAIYERLADAVDLKLPRMDEGEIKVGLREKARKREPYLIVNGNLIFFGGLYKNGFILSLKMTRTLSHQYL